MVELLFQYEKIDGDQFKAVMDGTYEAPAAKPEEVAPEAQGDAIPAAFTRTIPVPGHWPLMKPAATDVLCGGKQNRPERALAYGRGP